MVFDGGGAGGAGGIVAVVVQAKNAVASSKGRSIFMVCRTVRQRRLAGGLDTD
jgi:hypothetical protein